MRSLRSLPLVLALVLPIGVLAPGCAPELGTKGQMITCQTDPGTGVVLRCAPGDGSGSNTCHDIDEDGDGDCHDADTGDSHIASAVDDDDGDGIPNEDDCDNHTGEDDGGDLPYDVKPQLGQSARPIVDAFAEKGAQPAAIVSVTMDGGSWRLAELQAGTAFTVTQADCDHPGNRDTGRDRVFVTWMNTNGSTATDHLDIRYCK